MTKGDRDRDRNEGPPGDLSRLNFVALSSAAVLGTLGRRGAGEAYSVLVPNHLYRTAAALPDRVGAGASFHGGFLATDKSDSPHLLASRIKARLCLAIASDDDQREPRVKETLGEAFAAAEIELYPHAKHGWCEQWQKDA